MIKVKDLEMGMAYWIIHPHRDNLKSGRGRQKDGSEGFDDEKRDRNDSKPERNNGRSGS